MLIPERTKQLQLRKTNTIMTKLPSLTSRGPTNHYDMLMRINLVGYSFVGKRSLLNRIVHDNYHEEFIYDYQTPKIIYRDYKGNAIKLVLSISCHQSGLMYQDYMEINPNVILLCFDVTDQKSFEKLPEELRHLARTHRNHVPIIIVGNKCDLVESRVISADMANDFAKQKNLPYFEVSAKDKINCDLLMLSAVLAAEDFFSEEKKQNKNIKKKLPVVYLIYFLALLIDFSLFLNLTMGTQVHHLHQLKQICLHKCYLGKMKIFKEPWKINMDLIIYN